MTEPLQCILTAPPDRTRASDAFPAGDTVKTGTAKFRSFSVLVKFAAACNLGPGFVLPSVV